MEKKIWPTFATRFKQVRRPGSYLPPVIKAVNLGTIFDSMKYEPVEMLITVIGTQNRGSRPCMTFGAGTP